MINVCYMVQKLGLSTYQFEDLTFKELCSNQPQPVYISSDVFPLVLISFYFILNYSLLHKKDNICKLRWQINLIAFPLIDTTGSLIVTMLSESSLKTFLLLHLLTQMLLTASTSNLINEIKTKISHRQNIIKSQNIIKTMIETSQKHFFS